MDCSASPASPLLPSNSFSMGESLDPAGRYPSPMSTIACVTQPSLDCTTNTIVLGQPMEDGDGDGDADSQTTAPTPPIPALKRRRTAKPKVRRTEYLDLTKSDAEVTAQDHVQMERLGALLREKKKIVVIAGAGISVSAGIPDFRSASGLFARAKNQHNLKGSGRQLFDASVYRHDSATESFHSMVREMADLSKRAQPTPFHHLLASLSQEGRLLRLYSQNIDCLDVDMVPLATKVPLPSKGPWPTTVQLHGGLQKMVCSKCHQLEPFQSELFDGPEAPLCETCKVDDEVRTAHAGKRSHGIGRLRPRFVLYNEFNPDGEAIGNVSAADLKARPDAVIVVGTTLKVPGTRRLAKEMCQVARGRRDGLTVWINLEPEPKGVELKDCWDMVVRAKCDDVARLAALPPWDCDIGSDYLVSREDGASLGKSRIEIALPSPLGRPELLLERGVHDDNNGNDYDIGAPGAILTPHPSPKHAAAKTQTTIDFTGQGAPKAAAKKAGRKPRKPSQPQERSKGLLKDDNKAIQAFTTVKKYISTGGKTITKEERGDSPVSLKRGADEMELSVEPYPVKRQMTETTSPKTVPHGMQALID